MVMILVPVLLALLLGPGVGQLYNKEFKKGFILIGVSIALLAAFSIWLTKAALVYLPSDMSTVDRNILRDIIQSHIVPDHPATFYAYEGLLGGLWLYGVIDAFRGGMRRRALQKPPSMTPTTPGGS